MTQTEEQTASAKKDETAPQADKPRKLQNQIALPEVPRRVCEGERLVRRAFEWWNKVHKRDPDRLTGIVYRFYPVCVKPKRRHAHCELAEPPADVMGFYGLPEIGCGDYRIYLNDAKQKGKTYTEIVLGGFRDYRNYPPYVNLDELAWTDPANEPFISAMQLQGKMPSREEFDMQVRESEERSAISQLTGLLRESMQENRKQQEQQVQQKPSLDGQIAARTLDTYFSGQQAAFKIMTDAATEAAKLRHPAPEAPATPTGQLRELIDAITPLLSPREAAKNPEDSKLLETLQEERRELRNEIAKLNESRFRMLEAELKAVREKPAEKGEGEVEKYLAIRKKLQELGIGGEGATDTDKVERYLQLATVALPAVQGALSSLATLAYNTLIAGRNPNAEPMRPPEEQAQPQRPQITPGAPTEQQQVRVYLEFIDSISEAIMLHVQSDTLTGEDFADWMVHSRRNGLGIYRALKEQPDPKATMVQLLQAHQGIWSEIGAAPQTLERFLNEFLSYDDQPKGEEDGNEDEESAEGAEKSTVPVS